MNGVIIVDKPTACTSHDIVRRVRKAIGQRSVGHAGTLDPLATGVLVVALGEATKLVSHLQAHDKRYTATIALGASTDSLDADGTVVERAPVPALEEQTVRAALDGFVGRHPQEAPRLSAIKQGGTPLHRRVRRGEDVEAPVREVELFDASLERLGPEEVQVRLHCGKGYYVRSLARDLAAALGTLGHIVALRRTASGPFDLGDALPGDEITADAIAEHMLGLSQACRSLKRIDLDDQGVEDARHGRLIDGSRITGSDWDEAPEDEPLALYAPDGEVVALGRRDDDSVRVVRGFVRDR